MTGFEAFLGKECLFTLAYLPMAEEKKLEKITKRTKLVYKKRHIGRKSLVCFVFRYLLKNGQWIYNKFALTDTDNNEEISYERKVF